MTSTPEPSAPRLRGVAIVVVLFAATALSVGTGQYAFGLFITPMVDAYGWSHTAISASLSFAAVGGLAAPFIGRAMDRYGAAPILAASLGLGAASLLLRPLMTELWHWYALSFMQFFAFSGATGLPAGKLVPAWFPRQRGRMMAIALMGNNFGGLTVPVAVGAIIAAASWQGAYVTIGMAMAGLAVVALFVVRDTPQQAAAGDDPAASSPAVLTGLTVREALRSRVFYAVLAVLSLGTFTYSTVLPHVLAHLVNEGLTVAKASFTVGTLAIGGFVGKLAFGFLIERAGARVGALANLSGQACFAFVLALVHSPLALTLVVPAFGFFMGGFGVVNTLLVQETFGLRNFGSIMGLMNMSAVVSFGLGPLLAGASFDLTGSYALSFAVVSAMFSTAVLTLAFTRLPRVH